MQPGPPKLTDSLTEIQGTNFFKLAFVHVLRKAFGHPDSPQEYRYVADDHDGKQLWITRAYPKRLTGLPAILVEADDGINDINQIGEEISGQILSDPDPQTGVQTLLYNTYSGLTWITVNLTVLAETTTDRERLTDLLMLYVRVLFRQWFANNKVQYLDIKGGDDGEDVIEGKTIYRGKVRVRCQGQFSYDISMAMYAEVMSVQLTPTFAVQPSA
jgi:hypothetical protein